MREDVGWGIIQLDRYLSTSGRQQGRGLSAHFLLGGTSDPHGLAAEAKVLFVRQRGTLRQYLGTYQVSV